MFHKLHLLAGIILSLFFFNSSYATHTYGGELLYTHISGNTYNIKLTIYGDCAGLSYPSLISGKPVINIFRNTTRTGTLTLTLDSSSVKEVTPVCKAEANNTTCKGGTIPGIVKYEYNATYTVSSTSNRWRFVFNGDLGSSQAGRTNSVTNLSGTGIMYLEAVLNNTVANNSSPDYTSVPTPFFCINQNQEYNQGAIDTDNDSLYFSLTAALNNGTAMAYASGYSATLPISVNGSNFNFDSKSGQMTFTPDIAQTSVVLNKIDEYRNGVLIGSSMREMTFIVFNNCNNTPPSFTISSDSIKGAGIQGNTLYSCLGTKSVSFSINPVDPNGDGITITASNLPPKATLNVTNNGTNKPNANFYWDTENLQPGTHTLFINMKDDGCPLSSNQTLALTINIIPQFSIKTEVLEPTRCYHKQYSAITISDGLEKKNITIRKGGLLWATYSDSSKTTVIRDSFTVGEYEISVSSPFLPCTTNLLMKVVDSGTYPIIPLLRQKNLCVNDPVEQLDIQTIEGFQLNWYNFDGTRINTPVSYTTSTPATYTYIVTQTIKACESLPDTYKIIVHPLPDVRSINQNAVACLGDTLNLRATGAATYKWLPEYRVKRRNDTSFYTRIMETDLYTVIGMSLEGCVNTDSFRITSIEDCCTFSYPSAFTPNGDGLNDGFKPIMYGNQGEYLFAVYNRWGQQVFITSNPRQYWDGTFNSQKCDVGVYYYKFRATCLTGRTEIKSGEVMLIR